MNNFKTKFRLEGLPITVGYNVVIIDESGYQMKSIVVGRLNNNENRNIDHIAITKTDKDDN